jgi:hypothetical protein
MCHPINQEVHHVIFTQCELHYTVANWEVRHHTEARWQLRLHWSQIYFNPFLFNILSCIQTTYTQIFVH